MFSPREPLLDVRLTSPIYRQIYGKLEKLTERLLARLHPSNLVNTIFLREFFDVLIHKLCKIQFGKIICCRIPIQTLLFLTTLPARQDDDENCVKIYERKSSPRTIMRIVTKTPHEYIRVTYEYIRVHTSNIRVHTSKIRAHKTTHDQIW